MDTNFKATVFIKITKQVFDKLAYRENRDGLIALVQATYKSLADIKLSANPLIIVLESIEKPGNLGAILRTADAAYVDAVIVCDKKTDIFNPNVIRSSLGCVFTNQVVTCSADECLTWLEEKKIKSYAAALTATKFYHQADFKNASAIFMGTEADGLSDTILNNANQQIKIPMSGKIDSLNVSTSCSIIVFEAKRQRDFKV
jgi:TrmH family RNA methyltransferase